MKIDTELEENHIVFLDEIKRIISTDTTCNMFMSNGGYTVLVRTNPEKLKKVIEVKAVLTYGELNRENHKGLGNTIGVQLNRGLLREIDNYLRK